MTINLFLVIDGIEGEAQATDPPYRNSIEVQSWSWGANGSTSAVMGPGAVRPTIQSLTCTKWVDRATPKIYECLLTGRHIPRCILSCVKPIGPAATAKHDQLLVLTMNDCVISNAVTNSRAGEERITENVTLHFSRIQLDYYYRDPQGHAGSTISFKWDVAHSAPF